MDRNRGKQENARAKGITTLEDFGPFREGLILCIHSCILPRVLQASTAQLKEILRAGDQASHIEAYDMKCLFWAIYGSRCCAV